MMKKFFILLFLIPFVALWSQQAVPAFPGAEGGGAYASGGRGGTVYYVNSLEDTKEGDKTTNEGTLRWCLDRLGPKTIIFKVAGIINLTAPLNIKANTTIAGQTAPGDGICIAGNTVKVTGNDVIVRFLRFRMGDLTKVEDDSFKGTHNHRVIIDHCSMSWATDEVASFYDNSDFTMQWCIISEALTQSVHRKGSHGYGAIWGGKTASYHHNLLASNDSRNPRMCGSRYSNQADLELVDFRNNVVFNWGKNSGYAGEGGCYNFINNYYKPAKDSSNKSRIFSPNADDGSNQQQAGIWGSFYVDGNYMLGNEKVTKNNELGVQPHPASKPKSELLVKCPFEVPYVTTHTAEKAFDLVLEYAGASLKRDETDLRIIKETKEGLTPEYVKDLKLGLINSQTDVGGWNVYSYNPDEVPVYSVKDGVPEGWMSAHYPGKKATDINEEGYTYLEVYLNSLIENLMVK